MLNPTKTALEALTLVNGKSGDPRLTFVTLLTAASIAGKIIGLDQREIRRKLKEVDGPVTIIFNQIAEKSNADNQGQKRS
jgi:hypothetical protein